MVDVRILIVGGASMDTLHGASQRVAGGAGMYTAMSAYRSGAVVSLCAPRPDPVPRALQQVANRLTWLGPTIAQGDLAHFEITYHEGQANYVTADFGAESTLSPTELPDDLSMFDWVHLVPLGDIKKQHQFLLACRERSARRVSAGTALDLINDQPQAAAAVLRDCDAFFMNDEEAIRLFGSMSEVHSNPGQSIFVTKGHSGASVILGDTATEIPGISANVMDPTGAGDTFCGATLFHLAAGQHAVIAARHAMPLAAQMIEHVGPTALLHSSPAPLPDTDRRVDVNPQRVQAIAELISHLPDVQPFDFVGPDLPAIDQPATLNYFFAATLQQFGFWTTFEGRYAQPLVGTVKGAERKGAFYLFRAYLRWLENDPEMLTPARQENLSKADMMAVLRADDGTHPMPALDLHLSRARQYGRDMQALGLSPQLIVKQANNTSSPLRTFIRILDDIGGYREDPLRKKTALLAIILQQRPEQFLTNDGTEAPPAIDYHLMRSCLRTGLINVNDDMLATKLAARRILSGDEEWAVRIAAFKAIEQVVEASGKCMGAVDWFFFQARQRCPEMSEPLCSACAVDPACAHRKQLFQPVLRTSFY